MLIKVTDKDGTPVDGAFVPFLLKEKKLGGCTTGSSGACNIDVAPLPKAVTVRVQAAGHQREQSVETSAGSYTFRFDELKIPASTGTIFDAVERHLPALIGIVFLVVGLIITFAVSPMTLFQQRIILATVALAGGGIAAEIPGFLHLNASLGQRFAIQAGGATAVFIVLYLLVPAQ